MSAHPCEFNCLLDTSPSVLHTAVDLVTAEVKAGVEEDSAQTWRQLACDTLNAGKKLTAVSLLGTIAVTGFAPVLLPLAGVAVPAAGVVGSIFSWTTGIASGELGGWLTSLAKALWNGGEPEKGNQEERDERDELRKNILIEESKKLTDEIEDGSKAALALDLYRIIKQHGLLDFLQVPDAEERDIVDEFLVNIRKELDQLGDIGAEIEASLTPEEFVNHLVNIAIPADPVPADNSDTIPPFWVLPISNDKVDVDVIPITTGTVTETGTIKANLT